MSTPSTPAVRIFISHSHADNAFCLPLVEALRQRYGTDAVWFDISGGLTLGDEWWSKIRHELRTRPIFIVVLSHDAMASRWVNDEVSLAWNQRNQPGGKYIIPLVLQPDATRDDIGTLRNKISFVPPRSFAEGFAALTKQIDDIGRKLAARDAPPPVATPRDPRALVRVALVAALVVSLLGIALAVRTRFATSTRATVAAARAPTTTPTVTPNVAATQTATINLAYTEPAPGCGDRAPFWNLNRLTQVNTTDEFKSANLAQGYICLPNAGGTELLAQNRSAGADVGISMTFNGQGDVPTLPAKNTYQFSIEALANFHMEIRVDRINLILDQHVGQEWYYFFEQSGVPPGSGAPTTIDFPNGNFTFAATCDGQQVTIAVNGTTMYTTQLTSPLGKGDAYSTISVATASDMLGSMTIKDFRFSPR